MATDRHIAFIEEIQSKMKHIETEVNKDGGESDSAEKEDLMAELERKFDELFGNCDDE